ncbi:hypothetical protein P692DRAFT_201812919 [Suillus brevipes Sb2]|nr:hypothetical protein P692DRAFT_201812919 [Suillus brevipes Sb2]
MFTGVNVQVRTTGQEKSKKEAYDSTQDQKVSSSQVQVSNICKDETFDPAEAIRMTLLSVLHLSSTWTPERSNDDTSSEVCRNEVWLWLNDVSESNSAAARIKYAQPSEGRYASKERQALPHAKGYEAHEIYL